MLQVNDSGRGRTVTPKQFKAAIEALGLSQGRAARLCGFHARTAKRWAGGQRKVPEPVSILLRLMQAGKISIEDIELTKAKRK
jgi:DNA-binding transcriptional regulator YiaG